MWSGRDVRVSESDSSVVVTVNVGRSVLRETSVFNNEPQPRDFLDDFESCSEFDFSDGECNELLSGRSTSNGNGA